MPDVCDKLMNKLNKTSGPHRVYNSSEQGTERSGYIILFA